MLNRRELIKLGLYGSAALLHLTGGEAPSWALDDNAAPSPAALPFQVSLPIPAVKQAVNPSLLSGGPAPLFNDGIPTKYYELFMRQATSQIFRGPGQQPTVIWGYDGLYPGPMIKARVGERVIVRQHNQLPTTGIVHRHGGHNPSASDGSALFAEQIQPESVVGSGAAFRDFIYPNDDDVAATNWYHDHDIDFTGHNVFMGLAGFYLLQDQAEFDLNLPGGPSDISLSGEAPFDIPLVFQDRLFDGNNQLAYNPFDHDGVLGDTFLVNGAIQPKLRVANRKYRFRLLNGSNARFYEFSLSSGAPFRVIGSDGGLLRVSTDVGSIRMAPAERVEVIIDFSRHQPGPETHVYLNNCLQQTSGRGPDGVDLSSCTPVLRFDVEFSAPDPSSSPTSLRLDLPQFNEKDAVITRDWEFNRSSGAWQINGKFFDPARIDATVKLNTTEIWRLKNGGGGWYHPIHIHRNEFRILDRNGKAPSAIEQGLKDTFVLNPNDVVRVISKFTGDNCLGPYVFHCHNIEHEDMRMMGVFNVVR